MKKKNITKRLNSLHRKKWKKRLILRMKTKNPMFDPEVVEKVAEKLKGNQNARKHFKRNPNPPKTS